MPMLCQTPLERTHASLSDEAACFRWNLWQVLEAAQCFRLQDVAGRGSRDLARACAARPGPF
eukprot:85283-Chlamydomonas_euryale.AAC.1